MSSVPWRELDARLAASSIILYVIVVSIGVRETGSLLCIGRCIYNNIQSLLRVVLCYALPWKASANSESGLCLEVSNVDRS